MAETSVFFFSLSIFVYFAILPALHFCCCSMNNNVHFSPFVSSFFVLLKIVRFRHNRTINNMCINTRNVWLTENRAVVLFLALLLLLFLFYCREFNFIGPNKFCIRNIFYWLKNGFLFGTANSLSECLCACFVDFCSFLLLLVSFNSSFSFCIPSDVPENSITLKTVRCQVQCCDI